MPADKDWDKLLAHNAYYLVNNYHPGYIGTGGVAYVGGPNDFTIPPRRQNNIGLLLSNAGVSWRYCGEDWEGGLTRSLVVFSGPPKPPHLNREAQIERSREFGAGEGECRSCCLRFPA